jgi:hypothetical protein
MRSIKKAMGILLMISPIMVAVGFLFGYGWESIVVILSIFCTTWIIWLGYIIYDM